MEGDRNRSINITITAGTVIKTVVILVLCWVLYIVRDLVVVVLTALVIASAIEPLVAWLKRRHIGRTLSVIIIYLVLLAVLAGIFYLFVPSLISDFSDLLAKLPTYLDAVSVWNPFKSAGVSVSPVVQNLGLTQSFSLSDLISQFNATVLNTSQGFVQAMSNIFGGVLSFILIVVLSFYLTVQEDGVTQFLQIVLPDRYEDYVIDLWRRSRAKIGRWLQGQLLLGVIIGVLVYLGLTILGVRNALLLALLSAVFEIIPVFGPVLSAVPATIIALVDGGVTKALLVVGFYVIIHQFENHLIYPLVVRKIIGIPPIVVIMAIIVGFELAGVLGILLSVPIAAVIVELMEDMQKRKMTRVKGAAAG